VVIGKPGKKDMSNPKSYRCISLLSNVAKLTEKAVAQYLTLEGEVHGWWHPYQFGSRPGRHNTTDALMWLKAVVEKHRKENMNTALIYLFILSRLTSFSRCGYVDKLKHIK
jgi:hypothetical protein